MGSPLQAVTAKDQAELTGINPEWGDLSLTPIPLGRLLHPAGAGLAMTGD